MFKSMALLRSLKQDGISYYPNHDGFDDLESFYYVFSDIIHRHHGNGDPVKTLTPISSMTLSQWGDNDPATSAGVKASHFLSGVLDIEGAISQTWQRPSTDAYRGFFRILCKIVAKKMRIGELKSNADLDALDALRQETSAAYREVLGVFDKAIRELESLNERMPEPEEVVVARGEEEEDEIIYDNIDDEYDEGEGGLDMREESDKAGVSGIGNGEVAVQSSPAGAHSLAIELPSTPQPNGQNDPSFSPWVRGKRRLSLADIEEEEDEDAVDIAGTPSKPDKRPRMV